MFDNSLAQQYRDSSRKRPGSPDPVQFIWPAVDRWEGRDFVINVEGPA